LCNILTEQGINIPSTGQHIIHSNATSNSTRFSLKIPLEYVNILIDFGLIYPSIVHFPSISKEIFFSSDCLRFFPTK